MRGTPVNNLVYCLNGHYIGIVRTPEDAEDFYEAQRLASEEIAGRPGMPAYCPKCGVKTLNACPKCESPIRYFRDGNAYLRSVWKPISMDRNRSPGSNGVHRRNRRAKR
jgi:hypothetical protein